MRIQMTKDRVFYAAVGGLVLIGFGALACAMWEGDPRPAPTAAGAPAPLRPAPAAGTPAHAGAPVEEMVALRSQILELQSRMTTLQAEAQTLRDENRALASERDRLREVMAQVDGLGQGGASVTEMPAQTLWSDGAQTVQPGQPVVTREVVTLPDGTQANMYRMQVTEGLGGEIPPEMQEQMDRVQRELFVRTAPSASGARVHRGGADAPASQAPAVERPYLGVSPGTAPQPLAGTPPARGVAVSPAEGGPAAAAGIQEGDVVFRFGETEVSEWNDLVRAIMAYAPGATVPAWVSRDGTAFQVTVVLGSRQ